jgi:hypothetical protein
LKTQINEYYNSYINFGKRIATERGLNWLMPLDLKGKVSKDYAWNLTGIVGDSPPPTHWLHDFGFDTRLLDVLNSERAEQNLPSIPHGSMSLAWQDLIKSATMDQLFSRRNATMHVVNSVYRPLKVLATCTFKEPWELEPEDILYCYELARKSQPSGQLANTILGVIKNVFDNNHIANIGPIYPALMSPQIGVRTRRTKFTKSAEELRDSLDERKKSEKLPENKAFWELMRIVFTEEPKSFFDMLRFSQIKIMLLTGVRTGEAALLPADWKRTRDYYNPNGKPLGELGGYSKALMLRHFAEKQKNINSDGNVLFETAQYIPRIFEEILTETLDKVVTATQPLRETLKKQIEQKRILPFFQKEELVSVIDLYVHLTGNPFFLEINEIQLQSYINSYRAGYAPSVFTEIRNAQLNKENPKLSIALYVYFNRMKGKITFRKANGLESKTPRFDWSNLYLHVGELESYISQNLATKISDTTSLRLSDRNLPIWELMFLMPKRALAEGRNDGLCDITRYYAIGRFDPSTTGLSLGSHQTVPSLFKGYGLTDEDRNLTLNTHSLRHLQNTELFMKGVADTIITKRFNRRSITQSYIYDHRTLAEELSEIEIPADIEIALGDKTATVARMIKSGKASGPIVESFKKLQKSHGDMTAFEFLKFEADGFHSTPYGHCINSFTVDPCPKHLECFSGCRHLSATNLPENIRNLEVLEHKFEVAIAEISTRPAGAVGRDNQLSHASIRLESVRKLLKTPSGQQAFPNGPDLSEQRKFPRSVLDE